MNKKLGGLALFAILSLILIPVVKIHATTPGTELCNSTGPNDPGCVDIGDTGKVMTLLIKILVIVRAIFWIAAVAMIFYAAFLYLSKGANPKSQADAKQVLWYAVIAIIVALVATSIPYLIFDFLGGATT